MNNGGASALNLQRDCHEHNYFCSAGGSGLSVLNNQPGGGLPGACRYRGKGCFKSGVVLINHKGIGLHDRQKRIEEDIRRSGLRRGREDFGYLNPSYCVWST